MIDDVCKTRWVARIDGLERFEDMYEIIMVTLQHVRDNIGNHWSEDSKNLAGSLFASLSEFSFLMCLVLAKYFLYLLLPLTSGLQERELDIKKAYENVAFVKNSLKESRSKIEKIHRDLFERAEYMAAFVDSKPKRPRVCGRMKNRPNHPLPEPIDYYRSSVSVPFLDHLIREIDERFGDEPVNIIKGFSIIPNIIINEKLSNWKEEFNTFASVYERDLPGLSSLQPELLMWEVYWRKQFTGTLPTSISDTLKLTHPMRKSFPNIYAALRVLATVPVTSCECERSFSLLRRLKNYLRNRMGEDRLNGLALMSIHRDIEINFDDVITRFAQKKTRRMELLNILDDDEFLKE